MSANGAALQTRDKRGRQFGRQLLAISRFIAVLTAL
jgi:hypothetical protein